MRLRQLMAARPRDTDELYQFVQRALGLTVPHKPIEAGHDAPLAYLEHAFFEGRARGAAADCIVWANRGGGKTLLGAVATLLDLIFKPGIQVRILGGSLAQSSKMYEHLAAMFDRPLLRPTLATAPTQRRIVLTNRSGVEILPQSQKAVRGLRVHKMRCDEVEHFDPALWEAAQLVTRSGTCGDTAVTGSIEALSTMHRPGGLMETLIEAADATPQDRQQPSAKDDAPKPVRTAPRAVFTWNALDVIARCEPSRSCATCVLWDDCQGRAKEAGGFMPVDDLVAQWRRASVDTWQAEMLCRRPKRADAVYPNFDFDRHVRAEPDEKIKAEEPGAPSDRSRSDEALSATAEPLFVAGMDFGLRSPTVWLWAELIRAAGTDTIVHVFDEYQAPGRTLEQHLSAIADRAHQQNWPAFNELAWVGIDPAGRQRSSQTGRSDVDVLQSHGLSVRARAVPLRDGIERVRRRLDRGTLLIHPRCTQLIEAMRAYHFDVNQIHRDHPVKDGPDHACDALRYLILNLELGPKPVTVRQWA
jgi:hypothetical protein